MNKFALVAAAMLAVGTFTIPDADAQRARGARVTESGGVAAGTVHNNGRRAGARGVITDGQGNAAAGGVSCAAGAAGRACRAGATTVTEDGTVQHQSGAVAAGANGRVVTQGGFTRNPDGTTTGQRTTTATGEQGTYNAETTYDSETGVTRTVTCTNPAGAVVACPR